MCRMGSMDNIDNMNSIDSIDGIDSVDSMDSTGNMGNAGSISNMSSMSSMSNMSSMGNMSSIGSMVNRNKRLKILLVDDHRVLRTGMKLLLATQDDMQVTAEASDGQEALARLEEQPVDIVLLDLSMPGMGGMDCLREIRRRKYSAKVLILTMYSEQQYIREVMVQGADGYLCKDSVDAELFQAIRTVAAGERYLGSRDAHTLIDSFINPDGEDAELSKREKEVLALLARGYSLSVIAEKLYFSIKTVSTYKTRLMQKLGFTQKHELVEYALKHNWLERE